MIAFSCPDYPATLGSDMFGGYERGDDDPRKPVLLLGGTDTRTPRTICQRNRHESGAGPAAAARRRAAERHQHADPNLPGRSGDARPARGARTGRLPGVSPDPRSLMKVDLGNGMWAERDDGPPGVFHRAVAGDLG